MRFRSTKPTSTVHLQRMYRSTYYTTTRMEGLAKQILSIIARGDDSKVGIVGGIATEVRVLMTDLHDAIYDMLYALCMVNPISRLTNQGVKAVTDFGDTFLFGVLIQGALAGYIHPDEVQVFFPKLNERFKSTKTRTLEEALNQYIIQEVGTIREYELPSLQKYALDNPLTWPTEFLSDRIQIFYAPSSNSLKSKIVVYKAPLIKKQLYIQQTRHGSNQSLRR